MLPGIQTPIIASARPRRPWWFAAALVAAGALVMAGCSDDGGGGNVVADGGEVNGLPTQPAPTTVANVAGEPCKPATDLPPAEGKPEVTMPEGQPPDELVTETLSEGDGAEATEGSYVTVQYVGVACSTGEQFDASWDRGQPFSTQLTSGGPQGGVIPGWVEGITGMKVGGQRRLVIPPDLAYGPQGQPPQIAGGETLVFVVDLLDVSDEPPPTSAPPPPATSAPAPPSTGPPGG